MKNQVVLIVALLFFLSPYVSISPTTDTNTNLLSQNIIPTKLQAQEKKSWAEITKKAKDCVVQIFSYIGIYNLLEPFKTPEQMEGRGSGFFINTQGEILTNFHVIDQSIATYIQIPSLGKDRFKVEFIGANPEKDFAKLKLTPESLQEIKQKLNVSELPCLPLGDSDTLFEAQEIMALGYPMGDENLKISIGRFAGRETTRIGNCLQTTAPINPGNSGGPFLDEYGTVVGIATLKKVDFDIEGVAYLIPINNIKIMLNDLETHRIIKNPFWGCVLIPTTTHTLTFLGSPEDGGVYLAEVKIGSLAEEYGMQAGDIIYQINGKQIDKYGYLDVPWSTTKIHVSDFTSRLAFGSIAQFIIYRQGKRLELSCEVKSTDSFEIEKYYPWIYPALDYEIIGGMVIMPLTINHIELYQEIRNHMRDQDIDISAIEKYKEEEERLNPRLIITTIYPSSLFHDTRCFKGGDRIISKVNGTPVTTLAELRGAIEQHKDNPYVTIETEEGKFAAIPLKQALAEEDILSQQFSYPKTTFVQKLQKNLSITDQE
ncbi:MAG: trypsin-like peptidase domain-containing protein [bacterium]